MIDEHSPSPLNTNHNDSKNNSRRHSVLNQNPLMQFHNNRTNNKQYLNQFTSNF